MLVPGRCINRGQATRATSRRQFFNSICGPKGRTRLELEPKGLPSAGFAHWGTTQASSGLVPSIAGTPRSAPKAMSGSSADVATSANSPATLRIHYIRKDHNYKGWGLHVWGDTPSCTQWQQPLKPTRVCAGELIWDLPLRPGAQRVGALVHKGEEKAASGEVQIELRSPPDAGGSGGGGRVQDAWLVGFEHRAYDSPPDMSRVPAGSVNKQAAHWVSPGLLLWRQGPQDEAGPRSFALHFHDKGYMHVTGAGVQGAQASWPLTPAPPAAASAAIKRFPHLYGTTALVVPTEAAERVEGLVRGQLLVGVLDANGEALDSTGVQIQGVLDETLSYDGPLGDHPDPAAGGHAITLWAPTATDVKLLYYGSAPRGGTAQVYDMSRGPQGTWCLPRPPSWLWSYYTYRVTTYCPWTARFETLEVTDPYSRGLAADGARTQIVDLSHPATQPPGWHQHTTPPLAQWTDISVYELHVRDFSMTDPTVPEHLRGTYLAFCPNRITESSQNQQNQQNQEQPGSDILPQQEGPDGGAGTSGGALSAGLRHLAALRAAGVNHLHLLPTYDFATVPERRQEQRVVQEDLSTYPPDSPAQQAAVLAVADADGFNWGYDPVHWGVPEGSYATDPDGVARIREFREMVQSLHVQGWRVVQDVVYNHTFASGPFSRYSVLDKIVPGYYHRRHEDGAICDSTCCNNTATEHVMCERLVVEDIVHWACEHRVDGFRFDIMGHLMMSTMNKMRAALDGISRDKYPGVYGTSIYLYGEAWDFGEVAGNQRGRNAAQMNLAGTRLGAFNDRLRDGALGGGPFAPPQFQGLATGLFLAPNPAAAPAGQGSHEAQRAELLVLSDWVRSSLAGNLRSYPLHLCDGSTRPGEKALAHGLPLAYGGLPCEHIAFIGCHDNKTTFDQIVEKTAATETAEERMRVAVMCLALISWSQGVPFVHAGDDLLRSKSLDRDSYNSGDWFNRIDWTGATHGFGSGLPVGTKNMGSWDYMRPLLAAAADIKPSEGQIATATRIFQAMMRVRYSSPLFRLAVTEDVVRQVAFHNTGPDQNPGVIVMELSSAEETKQGGPSGSSGDGGGVYDPTYVRLIAVFNCAPYDNDVPYPPSVQQGAQLELHPDLAAVGDTRLSSAAAINNRRQLHMPPRTAAVFVQRRITKE